MRKNVINGYHALEITDITTSTTSKEINVLNLDKASIHILWNADANPGDITIWAKNGEKDSWFALDFGTGLNIPLDNSFGEHVFIFNELPHYALRIDFMSNLTATSGSIDAYLVAKQVGG